MDCANVDDSAIMENTEKVPEIAILSEMDKQVFEEVPEPMETEDNSDQIDTNGTNSAVNDSLVPDQQISDEISDEPIVRRKKGKKLVIDSDESDQEDIVNTQETEDNISEAKPTKSKRIVLPSDSEDEDKEEQEEIITPHNKSYTEDNSTVAPIYTSNSKGELIEETPNRPLNKGLADLCDSESSDDEEPQNSPLNNEDKNSQLSEDEDQIKPIEYKKKPKKDKENDTPKMTNKEAAKQKREIQSESQRMLRESNVTLPYHKPKSYSLKEFLEKRKTFSSALPLGVKKSPSVAIKMSKEQLEIVSKNIKEREQKIKEFYKSDSEKSDDDDDSDEDYKPDDDEPQNDEEPNKSNTAEENVEMDEVQNKEANVEQLATENIPETITKATENDENLTEVQESQENTINPQNCVTDTQKTSEPQETATDLQETVTEPQKDVTNLEETDPNSEPIDEQQNTVKGRSSYEFNLDDMEDSEILEKSTESVKNRYDLSEFEEPTEPAKKSTIDLLKEKLSNTAPKLRGNPDEVIDLETGLAKPSEVTKLMERFARETAKVPHHHKHKVQLNILRVAGGEILNETVSMNVEDDEEIIEEKPGAKLRRLKDELENQMALKRSEQWQSKATNTIVDESKDEEDTKEDYEEDILDNEDEEEFTESEAEEDDVEIKDKPRKKSKFVDEEADEEDCEDLPDNEEELVEDEEADNENEDNPEDQNNSDNPNEDNEDDTQTSKYSDVYDGIKDLLPKKKPLKRILKAFTEDSDDEEPNTSLNQTIAPTDDTLTQDEESPQLHQTENMKTPQKNIQQQKSEFAFLTPITFMSGLQNSVSKANNCKESPIGMSAFNSEPSPFKDPNWHVGLQKKLFNDNSESSMNQTITDIMTTQDEQELADMCTGKFATQNESEAMEELAGMCSGQFSETQPATQDLANICSGSFTSGSLSNMVTHEFQPSKESKSLDEDQDILISQLLDEEEMENFKKKFDSPVIQGNLVREVSGTGGVIDSDDENEHTEAFMKKNKKKLVFSDDENSDEDDEEPDNEEIIDLHDEDPDEEDNVQNPREVDYDSEENEIEADQVVHKASEFFDEEAELSESEWGSADEDETALDILETEKGDKEKFDNNKLRSDLEKIHMRRVLDEDNREIKLLQEMLLEDGELHGSGRERQFKWKNIDNMNDGDEGEKQEDEEGYLEEDETEEEWRKNRHERETFLREQLAKKSALDGDDNLVANSQILKLGQKVLSKTIVTSQTTLIGESSRMDVSANKQLFSLMSKRGSLLSRGDDVLQRLAEYNKESKDVPGAAKAKNSRNFVFQTVSRMEANVSTLQHKKRKATEGTPNVLKKIRLTSNFSPLVGKKGQKTDRAKKLFGTQ